MHPAGPRRRHGLVSQDEASIFWNLGIPGFSVGGVQDSNIDENPYPSRPPAIRSTPVLAYTGSGTAFELGSVAHGRMTTTAAAAAVGDTNVKVAAVTNLVAGQPFFIDTGQNIETGQIASVGTSGAGGTGVTLTAPLALAHASGVPFNVNQGQPVGFTGDTIEHLNFFAAGAPHGLDGETSPTEELLRALELPSQYTALLASGNDYLGAVRRRPADRLLRDHPGQADPDEDRHLRRELRADSRGGKEGSSTTGTSATAPAPPASRHPHLLVGDVGRREAGRRQGTDKWGCTGRRSRSTARRAPTATPAAAP